MRGLGIATWCALAGSAGCAVTPLETPPDLTLPDCAELDGNGTLFIESRVRGAGVRSDGTQELTWTVATPRWIALLPESETPAGVETTVAGLPAVLSTEPVDEEAYASTFARLPVDARTAAVWARIDLRQLCGPSPPDAPLTVWISSAIRTWPWLLAPGG